jgi:hypothetical protein
MDEEKPEPKISLPEAIFVGLLFFVLPDAVEFILIFFGLDDFWISDAIAFPGSQIYLKMKGVKGVYTLAANLAETLPYVGWLPMRTIGFGVTLWLDHHPKAEAVLRAAAPIATKGTATSIKGGAARVAGGTTAGMEGGIEFRGTTTGYGAAPIAEGGTVQKPETAPRKGVSPEALGEEKPMFEKLKEPMEELPQPEQRKEPPEQLSEPREIKTVRDQKETIEIDEENNQIDLRKAA